MLQEMVLGISSLSTLGPIGASIEIIVILYPFARKMETFTGALRIYTFYRGR